MKNKLTFAEIIKDSFDNSEKSLKLVECMNNINNEEIYKKLFVMFQNNKLMDYQLTVFLSKYGFDIDHKPCFNFINNLIKHRIELEKWGVYISFWNFKHIRDCDSKEDSIKLKTRLNKFFDSCYQYHETTNKSKDVTIYGMKYNTLDMKHGSAQLFKDYEMIEFGEFKIELN